MAEEKSQYQFALIVIVAIVAIVGIVVLFINTQSVKKSNSDALRPVVIIGENVTGENLAGESIFGFFDWWYQCVGASHCSSYGYCRTCQQCQAAGGMWCDDGGRYCYSQGQGCPIFR